MLKGLQRDSTHRKIWKTMKRLIEEEGYDEDESIDAAVNQRKFLLQRMLTHADVMDNTNMDIDHEYKFYTVINCQINMVTLVYLASCPIREMRMERLLQGSMLVIVDYMA